MSGRARDEIEFQKALRCWFCGRAFPVKTVAGDGIIRSRAAKEGGPYRLYRCPDCGRENLCERTGSGKWFASPTARAGFLDHLFSQLLDAESSAENLLASASWFRDNEERRRHFFEREGDSRYSGGSFLRRLFPSWKPSAPARLSTGARPRAGAGGSGKREGREERKQPAEREEMRERRQGERPRGDRTARLPERGALVTPHEILGVAPTAGEREIRAAFHKLAIHYHPDKARHLGAEFERVAVEKFIILKEAYEKLLARRRRG